jgi:hypothetical protein
VGLQLVDVPPEADAEVDPAAAEQVERGHRLGGHHRVPLGGEQDAGAHPQPLRGGGDRGEGHQRVEAAPVLLGELRVAGGRRRPPAGGDVGVLGQPERLEAALLGGDRQLDHIDRRVGREHGDAEAHWRAPVSS